MISVGTRLMLDFPVVSVLAGETRTTSFRALLGAHTLVSVYMRANTPSCDAQVAGLLTASASLSAAGVTVLAVSRDGPRALQRYAARLNLPFALVSDPEDQFSQAAEAMVEKVLYGRRFIGPQRAAYWLDAEGVVTGLLPQVEAKRHAEQVCAGL